MKGSRYERKTAPRHAGIGGHHSCIKCGESDISKFGRKAGKFRATCKTCTNIRNAKSREKIRARDPEWYRQRHVRYGQETRARRSPERAAEIERRGRLKKYGLTPEGFDELASRQRHRCAICRSPKGGRQWHIDHNHKTGAVRGLLCSNCNTALGLFKDDPKRLLNAISYLKRKL